jgi:hypothetical protein
VLQLQHPQLGALLNLLSQLVLDQALQQPLGPLQVLQLQHPQLGALLSLLSQLVLDQALQ